MSGNVFTFTGTLGGDAEVRYTPAGLPVLNFSAANNVGYGDRQKTLWIRVALFGKRAEGQLANYLKKGQQVFVSGELTQNEYRANDGTTRTSLELTATIVDLIGGRREQGEGGQNEQPQAQASQAQARQQHAPSMQNQSSPAYQGNAGEDPYDDDIPF